MPKLQLRWDWRRRKDQYFLKIDQIRPYLEGAGSVFFCHRKHRLDTITPIDVMKYLDDIPWKIQKEIFGNGGTVYMLLGFVISETLVTSGN